MAGIEAHSRVYVVGDIHGRSDLLDRMVEEINRDLETKPAAEALTVTLGDYIDRGPDSRGVLDRLICNPFPTEYIALKGNHEQAQVDWGHFGHLTIGRARRPLMAFVMVLSWSRQIFLRFFLDARMENFLRGHVAAFEAFNGCARVLLYDNLKSAVLERQGAAIRFHPTLWAFASHYRYEPRPVAVARGNEKGRVERAIRYVRDSFFAARKFTGLDDLNAQAAAWCSGLAADRPCPEQRTKSVREAFAPVCCRCRKILFRC